MRNYTIVCVAGCRWVITGDT